jgi:hypothetical protein
MPAKGHEQEDREAGRHDLRDAVDARQDDREVSVEDEEEGDDGDLGGQAALRTRERRRRGPPGPRLQGRHRRGL